MPESQDVASSPEPAPLLHLYALGPFRFQSTFCIPELEGMPLMGDHLVTIREGGVPEAIDGVAYGQDCWASPTEYLLKIEGVARFYAANASVVAIQIADGAPHADVSTFLLGSVFGALCHQSGLLPLHGSSVRSGEGTTAFVGESGAGKSTIAACLHQRGYPIFSDDICLLEEYAETMRVIPVAGWLKLWRTSLAYLGEKPEERHRIHSKHDKYRLYLESQVGDRPLLKNIVFLERAAASAEPCLQAMTAAETLARMVDSIYLAYIPALTGTQAHVFQQCGRALQTAKGWRLAVPWNLEAMDRVVDLVERELLTLT